VREVQGTGKVRTNKLRREERVRHTEKGKETERGNGLRKMKNLLFIKIK
jgi:hypothetical protein